MRLLIDWGNILNAERIAFFADAINTADDIKALTSVVSKPLFVNMGFGLRKRPTTPLISPREAGSI